MNERQIKKLIVSDIQNSNLSDLVKGILIEKLGAEKESAEVTKPVRARSRRTERKHRTWHQHNWEEYLNKAEAMVTKRPVLFRKIADKLKLAQGGTRHHLLVIISDDKRFVVSGTRSAKYVGLRGSQPVQTRKSSKPARKKSAFSNFLSMRVKYYMHTKKLDYKSALKASWDDWNAGKITTAPIAKLPAFPKIVGVADDEQENFKNLLLYLVKHKTKLSYRDISSVLNVGLGVYSLMLIDIVFKNKQIKAALGLNTSKNFSSDKSYLYWR